MVRGTKAGGSRSNNNKSNSVSANKGESIDISDLSCTPHACIDRDGRLVINFSKGECDPRYAQIMKDLVLGGSMPILKFDKDKEEHEKDNTIAALKKQIEKLTETLK